VADLGFSSSLFFSPPPSARPRVLTLLGSRLTARNPVSRFSRLMRTSAETCSPFLPPLVLVCFGVAHTKKARHSVFFLPQVGGPGFNPTRVSPKKNLFFSFFFFPELDRLKLERAVSFNGSLSSSSSVAPRPCFPGTASSDSPGLHGPFSFFSFLFLEAGQHRGGARCSPPSLFPLRAALPGHRQLRGFARRLPSPSPSIDELNKGRWWSGRSRFETKNVRSPLPLFSLPFRLR